MGSDETRRRCGWDACEGCGKAGTCAMRDGMAGDELHEECGVIGVWAPGKDVARLTYFGLRALQHRGQDSAGIAVGDGTTALVRKDLGLVTSVFTDSDLSALPGKVAIGHVRYGTSGARSWEELPEAARRYVEYVEQAIGCHIGYVSVGPERDSLIIR